MEPGQNKNGGAAASGTSATAAGTTQTSASAASPRGTRSAKGRSSGTTQDSVSVNTSRDTSGAFSRDASSYGGDSQGPYASADGPSVAAAGVRVRDDARQLLTSISTFTTQAQEVITKTLDERPYVALGTAFGIGYLLGGGLRSKLTGLALTVGGRYFLNTMGNQLLGQVRR